MPSKTLTLLASLLLAWLVSAAQAQDTVSQLTDSCVVSVLNRTAPVDADGTWVLPNVPANLGETRARATCVEDGVLRTGSSDLFRLEADQILEVPIRFDRPAPIPERLELTLDRPRLTTVGEQAPLSVRADYADGTTAEVSAAEDGTTYTVTDPSVLAVDPDGRLTALTSGTVVVSAFHEGVLGLVRVEVLVSGDSDGDGLPDDWELAHGLDPNEPADALLDLDGDGLSSLREFQAGTDPGDADSDGDGLPDGRELDEVGTSPVLFDTDGDGFSDGLEVATGSDPLDATSFDLAAAAVALRLEPAAVVLTVNEALLEETSRQLRVLATLVDGTEIDVAAPVYGTVYASADLTVANFAAANGRVFAGNAGATTVTAANAGFVAEAQVLVEVFSPVVVSVLELPGAANGVAVDGDLAFVAAGDAGLLVVDVSDLEAPRLVGQLLTPGNANDVFSSGGGVAWLAAGAAGLVAVDVTDPAGPRLLGSAPAPGVASDLVVHENLASVADETGLAVFDVTDPGSPLLLGTVATPGRARGVDVTGDGRLAAVADSSAGLHLVDLGDPASPRIVGSTHLRPGGTSHAAGVVIHDDRALVADGAGRALGGLAVVDFRDPTAPAVVGSSDGAFGLTAVAFDRGLALSADYFFTNAVPIFDLGRAAPRFSSAVDFRSTGWDDNGSGVATRDGVVFLVGGPEIGDNLVTSSSGSRLYVGRYLRLADEAGVPPRVELVAPLPTFTAVERRPVLLEARASDDVRLVGVRFRVDGRSVATDFSAPYQAVFTVPVGVTELRLSAVAVDGAGAETESETVVVPVLPNAAPVAELAAPVAGSSVTEGQLLEVVVSASDDLSQPSVTFFVDGVESGTRTGPPYRESFQVPLDFDRLSVRALATDDTGQTDSTETVTVTVLPDAPPRAFLLEPTEGREVTAGSRLGVEAGAVDDLAVVAVRFLADGVVFAEDVEAPYLVELDVPSTLGPLTLRAVAEDNLGRSGSSAEVRVTVAASEPRTTVVGRAADASGLALEGARITCTGAVAGSDAVTSTDAEGAFTLPDLPFGDGDLVCEGRFFPAPGQTLVGRSEPAVPVRGGVTDVGTLVLRPFVGPLYPVPVLEPPIRPVGLAAGDLDGDGLDDLVAPSLLCSQGVGIYSGRPDGSFAFSRISDDACEGTVEVVVADFDPDGHLDVAVATKVATVAVFRGRGDGTFEPPVSYPVGARPLDLETADFNGDGLADLVSADHDSDSLSVLLGLGGSVFAPAASLSVGIGPTEVTVADFDGDGTADLASADRWSRQVSVFTGLGDGTFAAAGTLPVSFDLLSVVAGDLDGDGRAELAAAGDRAPVSVFRALPAGGFERIQQLSAGRRPAGLALADMNADGHPDLFAPDTEGVGEVSFFRGRGNGSFDPDRRVYVGYGFTGAVAFGDFNHDGVPDLAATGERMVVPVYGNGDGSFQQERRWTVAGGRSVAFGDFNGDGRPDVAVGVPHSSGSLVVHRMEVFLGAGGHEFLAPIRFEVPGRPSVLRTADLDRDGHLDLLTAGMGSSPLRYCPLLGEGDGSFHELACFTVERTEDVEVGDLDGDGVPDFAAWKEDAVLVFLGRGDGTFAEGPVLPLEPDGFLGLPILELADLDGDGDLDVLAAESASDSSGEILVVFRNRGDATFEAKEPVPASRPLGDMAVGDLDGDGRPDLVFAVGARMAVTLGRGDGTFGERQVRTFSKVYSAVTLADVDLDGDSDLVLGGSGVDVVLGAGDGTFGDPVGFAARPRTLTAADMDGDGLPDLLTSDDDAFSIHFHR